MTIVKVKKLLNMSCWAKERFQTLFLWSSEMFSLGKLINSSVKLCRSSLIWWEIPSTFSPSDCFVASILVSDPVIEDASMFFLLKVEKEMSNIENRKKYRESQFEFWFGVVVSWQWKKHDKKCDENMRNVNDEMTFQLSLTLALTIPLMIKIQWICMCIIWDGLKITENGVEGLKESGEKGSNHKQPNWHFTAFTRPLISCNCDRALEKCEKSSSRKLKRNGECERHKSRFYDLFAST